MAGYGIRRTSTYEAALGNLGEGARGVADQLSTRLPSLVSNYPERTFSKAGLTVYRHPDPLLEIAYQIDEVRRAFVLRHCAAPLRPRVLLFISYCHKNQKVLEEFRTYAFDLQNAGQLEYWHDKKIKPGDDWEYEIRSAMDRSQTAVLLVTQDWLFSGFVSEVEVPTLLKRHEKGTMAICWIPAEPSTIHLRYPKIWNLQALSDPSKPLSLLPRPRRQQYWVNLVTRLHEIVGATASSYFLVKK